MRTPIALSSIVLAASSILATPSALAAETWRVAALIEQGGARVGEPTVVVRSGQPANVAVHGDKGYDMSVVVVPDEDGLLKVTVKASTSTASVSTALTTPAGKPVEVAAGGMDLTLTVSADP